MTEQTITCPICGNPFLSDECECGELQYIERIGALEAERDRLVEHVAYYLRCPSCDGRLERQGMRAKLSKMVGVEYDRRKCAALPKDGICQNS